MCRYFLILLFVAVVAFNLSVFSVFITFLYEDSNNDDEDRESSDSIFVIQGVAQLANALYGLTLVCFKIKMEILLMGWTLISFIMILISSGWDICFVLQNTSQVDGYALNTCVFIKVFGLCSLYVVSNYIREYVVVSKINAIV